jgi:hypothetical protein
MNAHRGLAAFRLVFVAYIVFASARTLISADTIAMSADLAPWHLYVLASAEIAAALALLWRRTERVGAIALILVFAVAAFLDTRAGDIPVRYAYYAATALFIVFIRPRLAGRSERGAISSGA